LRNTARASEKASVYREFRQSTAVNINSSRVKGLSQHLPEEDENYATPY
jgi:hypothetical protein